MYSLDLNQSWNTSDPAWSLIRNEVTTPSAFFAASYIPSSHYFLIDGGAVPKPTNQTFYFDTFKNTWTRVNLKGEYYIKRRQHTAVSDDESRVWLWGGLSDSTTYGGATIYHNTWIIINTLGWTASSPIIENNPPPRIDHTATMISSKYILITGGIVYSHDVTDPSGKLTLNPVSMSSLLLFNMLDNQWSNINAGGNIPAPRRGHSATLSSDGKSVIIFGGGTLEDGQEQLNDVFILELATMRWIAPSIEGVPPRPRRYHKAHLVGDYMLVAFGFGGDNTGFDDVNILSTSNWSWITQYNPNAAWLSGNTSTTGINRSNDTIYDPKLNNEQDMASDTRIKAGIIAGVVSGGVVILGGGIFLVLSIVIFKRKQIKKKSIANSNSIQPNTYGLENESTGSGFILEPSAVIVQYQKPDNRSTLHFIPQIENGEFSKPNAKNED